MQSPTQTQLITRKDQLLDVHGRHQTDYQERKRIGNPNKNCENVQSRYRNGIWHRKIRLTSNEKRQLPNQVFKRPEKRKPSNTWEYRAPLNKWKRKKKKKIKKDYLRRTRNYSRQNSIAETLSKG